MPMLPNRKMWTWFEGEWRPENTLILGAADHGTWLGSMVFDGARAFDGVVPDLDLHCARANHSAVVMGLRPMHDVGGMVELCHEGLSRFSGDVPLYIRPMYWARSGGDYSIDPMPESTAFALCIEEATMGRSGNGMRLTTTRFTRPTLANNLTNAKAACLYPNNARMLREAHAKGYDNALVCDANGNVAETASSNIFMVKDRNVFTPIPNGTFLNGITRQRVIKLLRDAGRPVYETTLTLDDFRVADEIFTTGNYSKVVPVVEFDGHKPGPGPVAEEALNLYMEWAHTRA